LIATLRAGRRSSLVDWSYVSAFFDGEGAIGVTSIAGSNVLTLTVSICQKSVEVLLAIKSLLIQSGIYAAIYRFATGMYSLQIGRNGDIIRFLKSVKSIVKRRQVDASLKYLEGKITGNALLQVLEIEKVNHRRKTSPMRVLGLRFPMTRMEAREAAAIKSAEARTKGNRLAYLGRLQKRVRSLPDSFGVRDIERVLGVSKPRAQVIGNLMVREGFVRSHFERVPPRFRKKVFERLRQE
jgi:hypothetical protein